MIPAIATLVNAMQTKRKTDYDKHKIEKAFVILEDNTPESMLSESPCRNLLRWMTDWYSIAHMVPRRTSVSLDSHAKEGAISRWKVLFPCRTSATDSLEYVCDGSLIRVDQST